MKPRSRIPIGLVALTLASIALTLLVFWSFRGTAPGAASNIQMSDEAGNRRPETADGPGLVLSPALFVVFVLSLLTAYWAGRQSGPLRSPRDGHGQLIDPSFSRARASLRASMGPPSGAANHVTAEGGAPAGEQKMSAEEGSAPDNGSEATDQSGRVKNERSELARGRRRLSTTGPLRGVSLEPRLIYFGGTSLRVAPHCPVRKSMRYVIRAMKQVTHSSRQIDQLVKIMDDFVFQANLLALEAAVAAGRTGQGGRGLTAVASRSRQLAICSAEAARNTADLVASVQSQIKSGSEMVQNVAENFITPDPGDKASETASGPSSKSTEQR